ncbi:MAG: CRISPR-associated endonuclease Cas6 [Chlorobi bacterium]|nr:CRISPR-associated endonuclease Cas6 [Chlorobiota bacterium]
MGSLYQIPILKVSFDLELEPWELRAFRSAVSSIAGPEHILFHNHLDDRKYLYKYPLIQYKIINKRPAIVCLKDGLDEIVHFFNNLGDSINILGEQRSIAVHKVHFNNWKFTLWEKPDFKHRIRKWLPFNEKNWKLWLEQKAIDQRRELLRKILIGNILAMAKGIGWFIDGEVKVEILHWNEPRSVKYKENITKQAVDVTFKTNVRLPAHIGLGKGVSFGFGTLLIRRD